MAVQVDERAVLGKNVELGDDVIIGPYTIIEDNVTIGARTNISGQAYIGSNTTLGEDCRVFNGASIGTIAQDLKFAGEECYLTVGDRTQFREFCTINKGTAANEGYTRIGSDSAFLAYCHVGHDCEIGDHFVSSNGLAMAGHVTVGKHVTLGGSNGIHQFTRIGDYAFIGGLHRVRMDIVPFALAANEDVDITIAGINKVGLERNGFTTEELSSIKKAYRIIFRKGLTLEEAIAELQTDLQDNKHIENLISFIKGSERGITRMKR